jgi:hypothetical protein
MLSTKLNQNFSFSDTDSTVYVNPGVARVGNTIMPFRGDSITFQDMVDFGDQSCLYQYSALFLQDFKSRPELAVSVSSPVSATKSLIYPELTPSLSNPYAPVYPIGLFLFYKDTTDTLHLISSQRIDS